MIISKINRKNLKIMNVKIILIQKCTKNCIQIKNSKNINLTIKVMFKIKIFSRIKINGKINN